MLNFDIAISKKYAFIKDCPEHQVITWLESNGVDPRPIFGRQIIDSIPFLMKCFCDGKYEAKFSSFNIWQEMSEVYGITNTSYNSIESSVSIDEIIHRYGLPVMLSCDSYYLPYSKNYNTSHEGTRVMILDVNDDADLYRIGEAPFHIIEWVDKSLIQNSHIAQQPRRGYFNIPRFPEKLRPLARPTQYMGFLEIKVIESLQQEDSHRRLLSDLVVHPILRQPSQISFVLECFMHLQAGWAKLSKFLEWVKELSDELRVEQMIELATDLVNAWQRLQVDFIRLLRKPDIFTEQFSKKLTAINEREYEAYRMIITLIKSDAYTEHPH